MVDGSGSDPLLKWIDHGAIIIKLFFAMIRNALFECFGIFKKERKSWKS